MESNRESSTDFDGKNDILKTKEGGGSQVEISNSEYQIDGTEIPFILPSRRHVNYEINSNFYAKVIDMIMLIMKYIILKLGNQ